MFGTISGEEALWGFSMVPLNLCLPKGILKGMLRRTTLLLMVKALLVTCCLAQNSGKEDQKTNGLVKYADKPQPPK